MKGLILSAYAAVSSAVILLLLYLVSPYVVEFPKIAIVVFVLTMLTRVGTGVRSMIEIGILVPMIKIARSGGKPFFACPFIFLAALLIAVALPWLNGVSDFNVWRWISSIAFTMFNFETFYAFVCATLRVYREPEYE